MSVKRQLLEETLSKPFDINRFVKFTKEFFNEPEILTPEKKNEKVWKEYKYYVDSYRRVARFTDSYNNKIVILAVQLKKERSVERARSMQRNFISKLISDSQYDAAIVAFYNDNGPTWRLSFVRLDYEFTDKGVKLDLTPAKRYSFLVGEGEPIHTVQKQLLPLFERENYNPTIDEIEQAFSVEPVTKEFFEKYKEKYFDLKEFLDNSESFNEEAERCGFTSEEFAKKLMGQLVFIYFLQKKGWLGVRIVPKELSEKEFRRIFYAQNRIGKDILLKVYKQNSTGKFRLRNVQRLTDDEADILAGCFKGTSFDEPWGSGPKTFIRDIFTYCVEKNKNFFDDYLKPLFYDALNKKRGNNHYYKLFNCKIPFLNGGLFEPLDNYDWRHNDFLIPNEMFSNVMTKGRDADGIIDIFDRYNFTINEDEPLEKEVAVDPEMLGKIFENLLDAKDRKSKGAFYTPREIVHYMCQECLINYLVNEVNVPYDDVKSFIIYGELMKDEDCSKDVLLGKKNQRIPKSIYDNLLKIDNALKRVRIADPAVGSGAFPLGMLNEIVKARTNITEYLVRDIPVERKYDKLLLRKNRHPYRIKWETIKNSIFGVDIDNSAVNIAKLRLWLSLVVDQEIDEDNPTPHPLPNLDYNIMCGNSLLEEFEGIRLFDESLLQKKENMVINEEHRQYSLFEDQIDILLEDLFISQDRFFGEEETSKKAEIKKNIDDIIDRIIRAKLSRDGNNEGLIKYEKSLKQKTKPYFLWKLEFAKIFKEKGGFDIVIGNPPYIDSERMVLEGLEHVRETISRNYKMTKGNWDIYIAFYELGFNLLTNNGILCYITPDKWISKPFGYELRKCLVNNIYSILNAGRGVFESAKVDSIVTQITKKNVKNIKIYNYENGVIKYKRTVSKELLSPPFALDFLFSDYIELLIKIEENSVRLQEICICENACATSDAYKLKEILEDLDPITQFSSEKYFKVINTGTIGKYVPKWGTQKMTYLKSKYLYPVVERTKFFEYFKNTYSQKSIKPKIIIKGLTLLDACLDYKGEIVPGKSTLIITSERIDDLKYILAIINSKLYYYYIKEKYSASSYNGGINFTNDMINSLPIKPLSAQDKQYLIDIVNTIIEKKTIDINSDITEFESKINSFVYKWHGLTNDEINLVEKSVKF